MVVIIVDEFTKQVFIDYYNRLTMKNPERRVMAIPRQRVRALSKNRKLVRQQRQHIVEAAFQVFAERGYEKTTVREIAAKAGMTPGNIYRYVGSKDDILHLLCQRAYDNTQRITNIFNENKGRSERMPG